MRKYRRHCKIRRRKKRSILKNRFFWLFILIFILFGGIFYFASFSRYFQVEGSEICGNEKVSSASLENILKKEIEKKVLFFSTRSIFLTNLSGIKEKILKDFPQIANVDVKRNFPNKISIQIKERVPVAILCKNEPARIGYAEGVAGGQDENCFLIDEEGAIIDFVNLAGSDGLKLANLAKIIGETKSSDLGDKVIEKKYLASILTIKKELNENQKIRIKELIPSEKRLTVLTFEGWQIFFNPSGDISDQILNLTILLKEKIPSERRVDLEYIDLRFGSKVYFKYR